MNAIPMEVSDGVGFIYMRPGFSLYEKRPNQAPVLITPCDNLAGHHVTHERLTTPAS